jgi:hypothetical protein
MTVRKFRSIEEMNEAQRPRVETDPARIARRASALFALARAFGLTHFTGVHKFRSIEESNEFRRSWTRERAAGISARPPQEQSSPKPVD